MRRRGSGSRLRGIRREGGAGGTPTLNFTRVSQTTYKTKKIELSLVLDVTGSMSDGGKINSLKTAANDLIDTLFASDPNKGGHSRITGAVFGFGQCWQLCSRGDWHRGRAR